MEAISGGLEDCPELTSPNEDEGKGEGEGEEEGGGEEGEGIEGA